MASLTFRRALAIAFKTWTKKDCAIHIDHYIANSYNHCTDKVGKTMYDIALYVLKHKSFV